MTQATTSSDGTASQLRRTPRQQRSRERVAAILTSTAALLEKSGRKGLTTTAIAEHAGMSVSSLYQFFANVDAIITELVRDWTTRFDAIVDEAGGLDAFPATLDAIVDRYADLFRHTPGLRAVYFGGSLHSAARALDRQSNARLAEAFAQQWARHLGRDADDDLEQVARVTVQLGDSLLGLAFRIDQNGDAATLAELKRVLHAYLRDRLPDLFTAPRP